VAQEARTHVNSIQVRARAQQLRQLAGLLLVELPVFKRCTFVLLGDHIHPPGGGTEVGGDVDAALADLQRGVAQILGVLAQLLVVGLRLAPLLPLDACPDTDTCADQAASHASNDGHEGRLRQSHDPDAGHGIPRHQHTAWPGQPALR
jgi:hypothetical protein